MGKTWKYNGAKKLLKMIMSLFVCSNCVLSVKKKKKRKLAVLFLIWLLLMNYCRNMRYYRCLFKCLLCQSKTVSFRVFIISGHGPYFMYLCFNWCKFSPEFNLWFIRPVCFCLALCTNLNTAGNIWVRVCCAHCGLTIRTDLEPFPGWGLKRWKFKKGICSKKKKKSKWICYLKKENVYKNGT